MEEDSAERRRKRPESASAKLHRQSFAIPRAAGGARAAVEAARRLQQAVRERQRKLQRDRGEDSSDDESERWSERDDPQVLALADSARARIRARRANGPPLVHTIQWMEPLPEPEEPKTTRLFDSIRARSREIRLHELDDFGREVMPEASEESSKKGDRASRRAERRAGGAGGSGDAPTEHGSSEPAS
uniref:Uncharacterized protein n=1 Tax=Prymnesium polylepis TaxID=72548 RepID=A0A7S4IXN3_9EUKA|mmetsp:Transcript_36198/g.90495  ORF Transcript_36198/g.90495 Transcript_36198/m.90495 type:complete len:188 (+) Transcript_36198:24-587(+)